MQDASTIWRLQPTKNVFKCFYLRALWRNVFFFSASIFFENIFLRAYICCCRFFQMQTVGSAAKSAEGDLKRATAICVGLCLLEKQKNYRKNNEKKNHKTCLRFCDMLPNAAAPPWAEPNGGYVRSDAIAVFYVLLMLNARRRRIKSHVLTGIWKRFCGIMQFRQNFNWKKKYFFYFLALLTRWYA